jgi:hypothetical protein
MNDFMDFYYHKRSRYQGIGLDRPVDQNSFYRMPGSGGLVRWTPRMRAQNSYIVSESNPAPIKIRAQTGHFLKP